MGEDQPRQRIAQRMLDMYAAGENWRDIAYHFDWTSGEAARLFVKHRLRKEYDEVVRTKAQAKKMRTAVLRRCQKCGGPTTKTAAVFCSKCWRTGEKWTLDAVLDAFIRYRVTYGHWPSANDLNRSRHMKLGNLEYAEELRRGDFPSQQTVTAKFGSWGDMILRAERKMNLEGGPRAEEVERPTAA